MIRTKSLREAIEPGDGTRILITRFRPRGVRKGSETWADWDKRLAPSTELFDAFYGRQRVGSKVVARDLKPISFDEYASRFLDEMQGTEAQAALADLRCRSKRGEALTLLCFCRDEARCHRSLLKKLARSTCPPPAASSPRSRRSARNRAEKGERTA